VELSVRFADKYLISNATQQIEFVLQLFVYSAQKYGGEYNQMQVFSNATTEVLQE
jgi:hypothetical protein